MVIATLAALALSTGACAGFMPGSEQVSSRTVTSEALARLRDIGPYYALEPGDEPLSISPDGKHFAFQMHRADPASNTHCVGILVVDTSPDSAAKLLNSGGQLIRADLNFRGIAAFPNGIPFIVTPRWSPDGRSLAFLRKDEGVAQAWVMDVADGDARPVTHSAWDIEDVAWAADGKSILVSSHPRVHEQWQAIAREALTGYHFDDRFSPMTANRPFPDDRGDARIEVVELASMTPRPASVEERALIGRARPGLSHRARDGREVWTAPRKPGWYPIMDLHATARDGRDVKCESVECADVRGVWWTADGKAVHFLKRYGWANSELAMYRWTPGAGKPKLMFHTEDLLLACKPVAKELLCLHESSIQSRHVVLLNADTGKMREVWNPNPEFARLQLGRVARLHWKTDFGIEAFGDLVLPPDHRVGQRHPLVIVQYESRGFLRGGTGDEYPIQPLAANGFAVLSLQNPRFGVPSDYQTVEDYERVLEKDWANRRNIHSSLERGVDLVEARGVVDPTRIGLSGLSDGSSTVQFAVVNSRRYAAISTSHCCMEPVTIASQISGQNIKHFREEGYPTITAPRPEFWKPYSWVLNAREINVPILVQQADDEYITSLEAYAALTENGKPIDMYVFPNETHVKWQPAHRLAIYESNIDWFNYWLQGREDPTPGKRAQYERWRGLRR